MKIFEYAKNHPQEILAITDDGDKILYGEMNSLSLSMERAVGHRLVFALCRNTPGSLIGYLALLQSGGVPLLLDEDIAPPLLEELVQKYRPAFCLIPEDLREKSLAAIREGAKLEDGAELEKILPIRDYCLVRCVPEGQDPELAPQLRLLLTTSGSTGSSKLVRISAENLDANAASIVEYLQITKKDRPITVLPMQYSYGMSILHTHLMVGAPIILTRYTLMERGFWERMQKDRVTSLCGVPYTFEIYVRVGLMQMDLPDLHSITQAGGKLPEKRHLQFAGWAAEKGIRFCVMYGQTEASPRMGWLPPEKAVEKCGSMGIAIPGGKLELLDENGAVIPETGEDPAGGLSEDRKTSAGGLSEDGKTSADGLSEDGKTSADGLSEDGKSPVGELVYTGPNVSLGYAVCAGDLAKGDEFHGVLLTGDMARRDADGFFYIVGRRSRFIKMAGRRVGLDEVEKILRAQFPELDIACTGQDDDLHVYVAQEDPGPDPQDQAREQLKERLSSYVEEMTGIPQRRISVSCIPAILRNSSGKIHYAKLP